MALDKLHLQGKLTVDMDGGTFLEDTRVRLLEAIDEYGSISQAARQLPISYKTAWDAVSAMNMMAGQAVVTGSTGGTGGGGSQVTDYGRSLVAFYRALESEYQTAISELAVHVQGTAAKANFRYLLRRQSMRRSAWQIEHCRSNDFGTFSDVAEC